MTLIWVLSCSDYGIKDQLVNATIDTGESEPELRVQPAAIELGSVCDGETFEVEIGNNGEALLTVTDLTISGDGWSLFDISLPFELENNESTLIPLTGGPGEAVLTIESNDPIRPSVEIPLSAKDNEPPAIELLVPNNNSILSGGEMFRARISDDVDIAPYLLTQWFSSVDGSFGNLGTDADGYLEGYWNTNHTAGDHIIGVIAMDSCGAETTTTLEICHQSNYTIDTLDLATWQLEGTAMWDSSNNWLQITDTQSTSVGAAFQTNQTVSAKQIELTFQFYIGEGSGADGFAVVALDTQRMNGFLGSAGGCLGYGNGAGCEPIQDALPGWVIEIDTFYNEQWDPTETDHIAFMFDGNQEQIEAWAELPELEDTGWHDMTILVNEPNVTVSIDGAAVLDTVIQGYFDFPAYIGFTGATGGLTNKHLIKSLSVSETSCLEE